MMIFEMSLNLYSTDLMVSGAVISEFDEDTNKIHR